MRLRVRIKNLLWLLFRLCVFSSVSAQAADVLVVLDHESEIHQSVLQGLRGTLDSKVTLLQTQDQIDEISTTGEFLSTDLIITIGSQAAHKVLSSATHKPVLSVLVPRMTYETLMNGSQQSTNQRNRAAIYLDQPAERQLALARTLLPQARVAGLMLGPVFSQQSERLREIATEFTLQLNLVELAEDDDPAKGIKKLISGSQFVLALYDPVVLKPLTAKWLLFMAYQRRLPVIGFSKGYLKAGAVAVVFTTPEQIGQQAGLKIAQWLQEGSRQLGKSQYPNEYEIAFNQPVAKSLELRFPSLEETRKRMAILLEENQ